MGSQWGPPPGVPPQTGASFRKRLLKALSTGLQQLFPVSSRAKAVFFGALRQIVNRRRNIVGHRWWSRGPAIGRFSYGSCQSNESQYPGSQVGGHMERCLRGAPTSCHCQGADEPRPRGRQETATAWAPSSCSRVGANNLPRPWPWPQAKFE